MNRHLTSVLCALAMILPVVALAKPPADAHEVRSQTVAEKDPYRKMTVITGPKIDATNYTGGWLMRTWKLPSSIERFQVYILCLSDQWKFLNRADDKDGSSLKFNAIDRKVDDGQTVEQVGVTFDRAYLESHLKTGIDMKISGKRDDILVFIPGYYISGFLEAVAAN